MLKFVQNRKGVRIVDAKGNEVAMITAKGRSLEIVSERLVGDGTSAGPFTRSVRFGQSRRRRPKITIGFQSGKA